MVKSEAASRVGGSGGGQPPKKKTVSLKNRIRSLERRSRRDGASAPSAEDSAEIARLRAEISGREKKIKDKDVYMKYRGVRFFERRRLMRYSKLCTRAGDAEGSAWVR
eukprot:CAMPEP_0194279698 /NCGR_PEP_ID=MMETSP0169-20130528/14078_1 /TAXON_ID=218684 /ORGANISM="Corethron pennatum, Strain L29A3" /LENGTH=107 /DNA_ID=CAMNT_0039024153 /DNA_START=111 /DNA_END=430 /DNA_ORIENTATION=-